MSLLNLIKKRRLIVELYINFSVSTVEARSEDFEN